MRAARTWPGVRSGPGPRFGLGRVAAVPGQRSASQVCLGSNQGSARCRSICVSSDGRARPSPTAWATSLRLMAAAQATSRASHQRAPPVHRCDARVGVRPSASSSPGSVPQPLPGVVASGQAGRRSGHRGHRVGRPRAERGSRCRADRPRSGSWPRPRRPRPVSPWVCPVIRHPWGPGSGCWSEQGLGQHRARHALRPCRPDAAGRRHRLIQGGRGRDGRSQ